MSERKETQCAAIDLPAPISVNALWRVSRTGKLHISGEYKAWKEQSGLLLNSQRPGCVKGPYALTIKVGTEWRGDLDNCCKAAADLLQAHNVIENDRLAQRILIERSPSPGMSILVVSTQKVGA